MGLPEGRNGSIAASFSIEELAASALSPLIDFDKSNWTLQDQSGLSWLECSAPGLPAPVYMTGAASSSLDVANVLHQHGLFPEWSSVLCLSQSAGRGQMRRAWASPEGNVYAALRLPNAGPFATFAAAPAIGGLTAEALHKEGFPVLLKWPNDLLQPGEGMVPGLLPRRDECRKAGGILLEERRGALIAGIGLNLASAPHPSTLRDNYVFSAGVLKKESTGLPNGTGEKKPTNPARPKWFFPCGNVLSNAFFLAMPILPTLPHGGPHWLRNIWPSADAASLWLMPARKTTPWQESLVRA